MPTSNFKLIYNEQKLACQTVSENWHDWFLLLLSSCTQRLCSGCKEADRKTQLRCSRYGERQTGLQKVSTPRPNPPTPTAWWLPPSATKKWMLYPIKSNKSFWSLSLAEVHFWKSLWSDKEMKHLVTLCAQATGEPSMHLATPFTFPNEHKTIKIEEQKWRRETLRLTCTEKLHHWKSSAKRGTRRLLPVNILGRTDYVLSCFPSKTSFGPSSSKSQMKK